MLRSKTLRRLLRNVDVEEAFGVDFSGRTNTNTYCPFHEDPNTSTSKSCSVSVDGLFYCKGCEEKGDVFDFVAQDKSMSREEAITLLKSQIQDKKQKTKKTKKIRRALTPEILNICITNLKLRQDLYNYITELRGITPETIQKYLIGCDEFRIVIPVFDEESNLVNLRRYGPGMTPKMLSFDSGYGKPRLYPLPEFLRDDPEKPVILCEGEWDCLLLRQQGFNAITSTGSVKSWDDEFNAHFRNKEVYIVYDVNDKHNDGALASVNKGYILKQYASKVHIVTLDLPPTYIGGDITDYFMKEKRTREDFVQLLAQAKSVQNAQEEILPVAEIASVNPEELPFSTLEEASHNKFFNKPIKVRCLVAGKGVAPYLPPRRVKVNYVDDQGAGSTLTHMFNPWEAEVLSLIQCSTAKMHQFFRNYFGIPVRALMTVEVLETFNIEELFLIPAIDFTMAQGSYVIRKCFYIGHGIQSNRVYDFVGFTLADPKDQTATHIFTTAIPAETDIDTFSVSEEKIQELANTFQTDTPYEKMQEIANQLAEHVTKIYGRAELHIAVDLAYHSPLLFSFDHTCLKKGWLEVLILGDTRTGKGFVTEGLSRHYRAGEVVSGENLTLAGLIGGVQHLGDKWTLVWGKVPLADRRLVVLDEAGALSPLDISKLSRIRSEGVAEITKIVSEKTTSRTRLIWLANPRPRTPETKCMLSDYNYGIESVPELIGAPEDIARFDYVLIVAHSDVSSDEINRTHTIHSELKYSSELCNDLIMWVWSRLPEQIYFEKGVEEYTMKVAKNLAARFTSKIPLIQAEDIRFKLARISAAVAGRTFSTPDGVRLCIRQIHVEFAYNFLYNIYSKPVCGYAQLSGVEQERQTLKSPDGVLQILQTAGENFTNLVEGLLEHRQITMRDLCDYAGLDLFQARVMVAELVQHRALIKEYSYYVKKPAFKDFLRSLKNE